MIHFAGWFLQNFGLFFGLVFLFYLYLMINRFILIYDYLRRVPAADCNLEEKIGAHPALQFLEPFFQKLVRSRSDSSREALIEALWAEVEGRINIHFSALQSYVNTIIMVGFAGTIFGSIGAFNEMFAGLAEGGQASEVFAAAWKNGLATALYTSLGAGLIGAVIVTLLYSRFFMRRLKKLETMIALKIEESIIVGG